MNDKNSVGRGGHYNAVESRELIDIIKMTRLIIANLNKGPQNYNYILDDYYKDIMEKCMKFLSNSGGSAIPDEFALINIMENKPIFLPSLVANIKSHNKAYNVRLKQIGGGSYAQVFHYRDIHYNVDIVIKRARENLSANELERFKIEFEELRKLDSPYITKAYNYNNKTNEYTMEFADQTLENYYHFQNQYLKLRQRKNLIGQLLKAFQYIHDKGLLHRDISYNNILLKNYDDQNSIIKVADFGLVKIPDSKLTKQGTKVKGSLNDESDLNRIGFENYSIEHETYALGRLIYFMLTGKSENYYKEKNKHLRNFVLKSISADKNTRFKSVEEIIKELNTFVYPNLN